MKVSNINITRLARRRFFFKKTKRSTSLISQWRRISLLLYYTALNLHNKIDKNHLTVSFILYIIRAMPFALSPFLMLPTHKLVYYQVCIVKIIKGVGVFCLPNPFSVCDEMKYV